MTSLSLPVLDAPTPAPSARPAPAADVGASLASETRETTVGNYFVANYPPFGFWRPELREELSRVLDQPPVAGVDLGVYAHIPFCRKRCHFCYFRVYTDKNSGQIREYLDAMLAELRRAASRRAITGRAPRFIYFGGGTPSYLSPEQLAYLTAEMKKILPWDQAEEITLEAEPGTLNERKLDAIRAMGLTRLSLGIEHFDDHILEINGRAHRSAEITRAYDYARRVGFPEINIDLIAGMVEETDQKWAAAVDRTIALAPDTATIYQMEVPYNTTIYRRMQAEGALTAPVADWATKRRWVDEAFARFVRAGYTVTSATTVVKNPARNRFVYRRGLFNGSDVLSVGVSAFGYVNGVNYQNQHDIGPYIQAAAQGPGLPTYRAYVLDHAERYIREFALQLKAGRVLAAPFAAKFGVDPNVQFASALATLGDRGLLEQTGEVIAVNRAGLLQIDRLLFEFFRPEHRHGRFA